MHSDFVDVTSILVSDGYLTLRSKESIALFNELVEQGLIWDVLSNLFNDYAENKTKALVQVNKVMLQKMTNGTIIEPKEKIVESQPKEISIGAPKKALKGKGNLMAQLKSGFNKIK